MCALQLGMNNKVKPSYNKQELDSGYLTKIIHLHIHQRITYRSLGIF